MGIFILRFLKGEDLYLSLLDLREETASYW
jgi:hypothetical protein